MSNHKNKHIPSGLQFDRPAFPTDPKIKEVEQPATITFHFDLLDLTHEYFNLGGPCNNWFYKMFRFLSLISKEITPERLHSGEFSKPPLRFHPHKQGETSAWPDIVGVGEQGSFSQFRFGKSDGGIHGILIDNVFHVIWIDPHHNMYPDEKYGGIKRFTQPGECCSYGESELRKLQYENERLEKDNQSLIRTLDEKTTPTLKQA